MSRWGICQGAMCMAHMLLHVFSRRSESGHPCACGIADNAPRAGQTTKSCPRPTVQGTHC